MLHRLATQLEHHEDDHLVVKGVTMMALVMAIATRIEQDIAIVIKMAIYCPQGSGTLRQQLLMIN